MLKFYIKVFYVMGKALSGELSCPCDKSCLFCTISMVLDLNNEKERCWIKIDEIFIVEMILLKDRRVSNI